MFILDRRRFIEIAGAGSALAVLGGRAMAKPTEASVFTADPFGGNVDSVIVMGEESALLVDAQMNRANAERLADVIAATGRTLETIFITHMHPDHVLGLAVLMDRFPDARPVAHAAVQPGIAQSAQGMLTYMSKDDPRAWADRVIIPDALNADHLMLEGERIEILRPMHGDTALITPLHIPALDTLIASDLAYTDSHVWVAENSTPEDIAKWRDSIAQLQSIGAGTVIPGHRKDTSMNDASVFAHTLAYLDQWENALATTASADQLRAAMSEGNDGLALGFALDRAIAAVYPPS